MKTIKSLFISRALAAAGVLLFAVFASGIAAAKSYPIAPPGHSVDLQLRDFLWRYNGIDVHSGWWRVGSSFTGSFEHPIYTTIYLWETSGGGNNIPFEGPQIEVGHWDGSSMQWSAPLTVMYQGTRVMERGDFPMREVTSAAIPLSAFGVLPRPVNTVRISFVDDRAHNQLNALATPDEIPEPSTAMLVGLSLGVLAARRISLLKY